MKIIISPAKKMKVETDTFAIEGLPEFLEDAGILMRHVRALDFNGAKQLWKCNDKLAQLNYSRFQNMNLEQGLTPAVLAYEGLQYQYMAPGLFTSGALSYIRDHLRILSGFYGLLKPFDGVTPYRLEMQAKLAVNGHKDLYGFWGERLCRSLTDRDRIIVNLASREYSRCIEKYMTPQNQMITVSFMELSEGKARQKATLAKMARGEMVRFMAENGVKDPEEIRQFHSMDFTYSKELSSKTEYIFVRMKTKTTEEC